MDMEQRVQALEQEIQILKSQIQATLLDIQEQLLNQAHPALHADEMPAARPQPVVEPPPPAPSPVRHVSLNPAATPASESILDTLPSRKFSLMQRMEKWASEKIEKIGVKRTRELVRSYAEEGRFDEATRDALLRFIEIYDSGRPQPSVELPAAKPPKAQKIPAAPPVVAPPPPAAPPSSPARPKAAPPEETPEADPDESQMILRLIAGVQSHGLGKGRKRG